MIYAVRYALGRQSGAPGDVCDVVRYGTIEDRHLSLILRDVQRWLDEDWHEHPLRGTWEGLVADLRARGVEAAE